MRALVLLALCVAALHGQESSRAARVPLSLRVLTQGVGGSDSALAVRAVRTGFDVDSAYRVTFRPEIIRGSTYFEFQVEKPIAAGQSGSDPEVDRYDVVVTCARDAKGLTLRLHVTARRDGRLIFDSFAQLSDGQPIAATLENATRDLARAVRGLVN